MEQKYINVVRSYSHKLVPENHGIDGHRFAPLDFFASYGGEMPVESSEEDLKTFSNRLYELAKSDVENAIKATLSELSSPKSDSLSVEDLTTCAKYIKIATNGGSGEEFEKAVAADKDKLSDKAKDFLRDYLKMLRA